MKTIQLFNPGIGKTLLSMLFAIAAFIQAGAQCSNSTLQNAGNTRYGIRIFSTTSGTVQYEAYANPTGTGCQLIGPSQFSLVTSSTATISLVNPNSSGVDGFLWARNTQVSSNGLKYSAVATSGSTDGPIPFNADDETSLFIFTITGTCSDGVRIFNNTSDPTSATLGGADFRNTFRVAVPDSRETYVANVGTSLTCPAIILPLSLSNFVARASGAKQVILSWETLNEVNTKQFSVERSSKSSANAADWQLVGTLGAAGTVASSRSYQLIDKQPVNGVNYYRLRTTDKDNKQTLSEIRQVNFKANAILLAAIYPNPVIRNGSVTIAVAETANYRLLDNTGRLVNAGKIPVGNSQLKVPATAGNYTLEISGTTINTNKEHHRIIVQ